MVDSQTEPSAFRRLTFFTRGRWRHLGNFANGASLSTRPARGSELRAIFGTAPAPALRTRRLSHRRRRRPKRGLLAYQTWRDSRAGLVTPHKRGTSQGIQSCQPPQYPHFLQIMAQPVETYRGNWDIYAQFRGWGQHARQNAAETDVLNVLSTNRNSLPTPNITMASTWLSSIRRWLSLHLLEEGQRSDDHTLIHRAGFTGWPQSLGRTGWHMPVD